MVLQNHSLDQDKSFQKLLKFRTWLCLPCILHFNMVCLIYDIYFGYFKETQKINLLGFTHYSYIFHNLPLQQAHEPQSEGVKGLVLAGNAL